MTRATQSEIAEQLESVSCAYKKYLLELPEKRKRGDFEAGVRAMDSHYCSVFDKSFFSFSKPFGTWKTLCAKPLSQAELDVVSKFVQDFAKEFVSPVTPGSDLSLTLKRLAKKLEEGLCSRLHLKLSWQPLENSLSRNGRISKREYFQLREPMKSQCSELRKKGLIRWETGNPFYFWGENEGANEGHVYLVVEENKWAVWNCQKSEIILDFPNKGVFTFHSAQEPWAKQLGGCREEVIDGSPKRRHRCQELTPCDHRVVSPEFFLYGKLSDIERSRNEKYRKVLSTIKSDEGQKDICAAQEIGKEFSEMHEGCKNDRCFEIMKTKRFSELANPASYKCAPGPWEDSICSVLENICSREMNDISVEEKFVTLSIVHTVQLERFLSDSSFLKISKTSSAFRFENEKGSLLIVTRPSACIRRKCEEVLNRYHMNARRYFHPIRECALEMVRNTVLRLTQSGCFLQLIGISCCEFVEAFRFPRT